MTCIARFSDLIDVLKEISESLKIIAIEQKRINDTVLEIDIDPDAPKL